MSDGSLPIWQRIAERLTRQVEAGTLKDGTRLPPEREMAVQLDCAVGTLRKALSDMETRGLLERVQGSGNYIRAGGLPGIYGFFALELLQGGGLPTASLISLSVEPKPEGVEFGPSELAYRIRRIRSLDDEPVAIEEIWFDKGLSPNLKAVDLSESIYLTMRRKGLTIARVEDRVSVDAAPEWAPAQVVGVKSAFVERFGWASSGEKLEYSRTWFDGDRAHYVSRQGARV